jgi:thiamine monophosphate kinase
MSKWSDLSKQEQLAIAFTVIGVGLALINRVRAGSVILAVGTAGYTYLRYQRIGMKRRIELYLPLGIAAALIVVAITLPHAR